MKPAFRIIPTLILFSISSYSQTITISGDVFGLMSEKVILMKKASKNVSFEGPISGAKLNLAGAGKNTSTQTDITGSYSLGILSHATYTLTVDKPGYSRLSLILNYLDDGLKTYYPSVSFMLKKDDNALNTLGEITISERGKLSFVPGKSSDKGSSGVFQSNQILLEKAALINNSSASNVISFGGGSTPRAARNIPTETPGVLAKSDTIIPKWNIVPVLVMDILSDTSTAITDLRKSVERSKSLLAKMSPGNRDYALLQARIKSAEDMIREKETTIRLQGEQLSESQKKVMYLSLFGIFSALSIALLGLLLSQRKKHLAVLTAKNAEITRINARLTSSIRYAATIQSNFFREEAALNQLFGRTFIFNQPKDLLSGDFYWFTKKNDHKILVVADCTGHGVPGALLTMLGHSLLDEIVSVKGETLPSRILNELCQGIMNAFLRVDELEYGMDITVLSAKEGSSEMLFSGISNGLYHCRKGNVKRLPVTPKSIGPELTMNDLKDQIIRVERGDCFFLMSDGYEDQFNGNRVKPEKFNVKRLENLLSKISLEENFSASDHILKTEIENWRGTREQIDDILIVGMKIE
jgi:serine phosphatase RsbU (regulator of sigma subunit)